MVFLAFKIHPWSDFFISGWGQLQITVEMILAISVLCVFFLMSVIFFVFISEENHEKFMYAVCTICGIIIAILITMNFVWPFFFGFG